MNDNVRLGLGAIAFLVVVWFINNQYQKEALNDALREELVDVEKKAIAFSSLKQRWGKKGEGKKLLRKLEGIKAFDASYKKGSNEVVSYKGVDAKMLDRLSYAIFASDAAIVSFELEKLEAFISLQLEVKP